jgi:hypothetical protein
MNIADAAKFITEGVPVKMEVNFSDEVDKKIDLIRAEIKAMTNDVVKKIDHRWLVTQVLIGIGLLGNLVLALV